MDDRKNELGFSRWKSFIDSVYRKKPTIFISGGEPFARKDILDVISYARLKELNVGICTNGTLLDKNKADELIELDIDNIVFSIHGNEKMHDKIVGKKGSFRKTIANVEYFLKNRKRTKVIINFTADESNKDDLHDLINMFENFPDDNTSNIDLFRIQHNSFLFDEELDAQKKILKKEYGKDAEVINYSVKEYSDLYPALKKITKRKYKIPLAFKPDLSERDRKVWYTRHNNLHLRRKCPVLWTSTFIQPDGEVIPCQYYGIRMGNILEENLSKIWNSHKYRKLRKMLRKKIFPGCKRCCKL